MEDIDEKTIIENDPFYNDAAHYWEKVPATINGMLGGFGCVSHKDIEGSKIFLQKLFSMKNAPDKTYALDCGAGIGRITKNLLLPIFDRVDMVEQNPAFLEKATKTVGVNKKLGNLYPIGLQNFVPDENKYDVIWCQWVTGHLKDEHFIQFLERCKKSLTKNGVIVIKENVSSSDAVETDKNDSSVTRPLNLLKRLIRKAEFTCVTEKEQTNFPKGLYAVFMIAIKPSDCIQNCTET